MDQPPPDQPPPDMPVAPPKLNVRVLWLTLLLPMVLTAVFMVLMTAVGADQSQVNFLNIGTSVVGLTSLLCWISFATCIAKRFIGPSRVLLILAYPIIQIVLVFCAFFVGCLVMLQPPVGFH